MRTIAGICGMLTLAGTLAAQPIAPGKAFAWTKDAKAALDSLAKRTIATHSEQSACVTGFAVRDTVFIIGEVRPAKHIVRTDSLQVIADGPTCEWWQPTIHSHVMDNGWLEYPSPIDYHTIAVRGVFGFLVSVKADSSWTLKPYP